MKAFSPHIFPTHAASHNGKLKPRRQKKKKKGRKEKKRDTEILTT